MLEFFIKIGTLKQIKRKGWIREGIFQPESIADHCFRTTVIALIIGKKLDLDLQRLLQLAIIHDLAESVIGDITPYDHDYPQKKQKEANGIESLGKKIDMDLLTLWEEFETGKTEESKICKQIDKFEMILQAFEYEKTYNVNLEEFWHAEKDIKIPILREMVDKLKQKRNF
ncbi:MAG: HD domain-containing protein [Candidatus Hodarchaeota archaeon]